MKKIAVILIVGAAGTAILVFALIFFLNKKPVVGVLLPTDDVSSYADTRAGILLAMRSFDKGVNFVNIDYTSTDIATVLSKAINKGIAYFVGSNTSSDIEKAKDVLNTSNAILIDSQLTNPDILESVKNLYTLSPTDTIQAQAIASYIKYKNYGSVIILKGNENHIYVNYLSDEIGKLLTRYDINNESFNATEIESIKKKPDAIVLVMSSEEAINAMKKIELKFGRLPFVGTDWTLSQTLFADFNISEGMVAVGFTNIPDISQSFQINMQVLGIQPDSPSILAYNALLVTYILARDGITAERVAKYLDETPFFGANGEFSFTGHHVNLPIYFYQVEPLTYELVWTFGG